MLIGAGTTKYTSQNQVQIFSVIKCSEAYEVTLTSSSSFRSSPIYSMDLIFDSKRMYRLSNFKYTGLLKVAIRIIHLLDIPLEGDDRKLANASARFCFHDTSRV